MHQRWVHERPRPGAQRLPRWDNRPALAHQVPLQPAGVLPQVSARPLHRNSVQAAWFVSVINQLMSRRSHQISCAHNWAVVFHPSNSKDEHQKSIFVPCEKGGYRLKDNVQFHLYISTSPCGDARIFSPHEAGVEGTKRLLSASQQSWTFSSSARSYALNFASTAACLNKLNVQGFFSPLTHARFHLIRILPWCPNTNYRHI